MKRALIMLAVFIALAVVGTFIGQLSLQRMIEQRLEADGLSWSASQIGVGTMQWSAVKNEAVELDTLSVQLGWPITVSISGARVDIREVSQWREHPRGQSGMASAVASLRRGSHAQLGRRHPRVVASRSAPPQHLPGQR